ncbi:hypothetical protein NP233_g5580 [Leucocoprinus birnbaumii]|uniref:DNA-(apurinic or apyrimidinic site) lyase n=1 Tax=Leucocoprinus birnbaumii TaxID=56174 RepID=A0AAD5VSK0_9AGAR|nr:hypothetical protein NP233_g5580 [Leucocoprinus birnbaumii]
MPFSSLHIPTAQLNLAAVLKCGQSFRWSILPLPTTESGPTHEYRLCLRDRVVCLRQAPDTLFYRAAFPDPQPAPNDLAKRDIETVAWLKDYFQLDIDLVRLYDQWSERDKVFARFRDRFTGIRILKQDPWENVVSFICSSNNNISRITKMVQGLCNHYSPPLLSLPDPSSPDLLLPYHPFPPPSRLSQTDVSSTLRALGFGYRAEFIQKTAKYLVDTHGSNTLLDDPSEDSERWLKGLRDSSTAEAREELLKLTGVGRKVADCILLMSLEKKEVVPVDTHVHQIAVKYYGMKGSSSGKTNMTPKLYDEVNSKLFSVWGEYAGWAHSVMFTADLKSFADFNSTPSASPQKKASTPKRKRLDELKAEASDCLPTPPITPGPTTLSKAAMEAAAAVLKGEHCDLYSETTQQSVSLPTIDDETQVKIQFPIHILSLPGDVILGSTDLNTQELIQSALRDIRDVHTRIRELALFSPNEVLDDISTTNLVYLTLPYVLAEVENRIRTTERTDRMGVLSEAIGHYRAFVHQLEQYEVVPEDEKKLYSHKSSAVVDSSRRRETKVLQKRRNLPTPTDPYSQTDFDLIASFLPSSPTPISSNDDLDSETDEILRTTTLLLLRMLYAQTHAHLESMDQELELLKRAPPSPTGAPPLNGEHGDARVGKGKGRDAEQQELWKLDMNVPGGAGGPDGKGPLMDQSGRPLRPFTILPSNAAERARLQAQVFGPGYNLPTMSVDEYLAIEKERGNIITGGGPASLEKPTSSEQLQIDSEMDGTTAGEEKAEEKRQKDESWAQYKDANPRGAGNTMNRG